MDHERVLSWLRSLFRRTPAAPPPESGPITWPGMMAPGFDQQPLPEKHPLELDHEQWGSVVKNDFIRTFLGDRLGFGVARQVYALHGQTALVAKIETTAQSFQNITEWQLWHEVQFTPWARWFAPCRRISPCGIVLIQERTRPLPPGELPKELPDFFTDLKPENFGLIDGQVVCHDYALHLASSNGLSKARVRKVKKDEWSVPEEE